MKECTLHRKDVIRKGIIASLQQVEWDRNVNTYTCVGRQVGKGWCKHLLNGELFVEFIAIYYNTLCVIGW